VKASCRHWIPQPARERSIRPSGADDPFFASYPGLRCACPGLFSMAPYGSEPMAAHGMADMEVHLELLVRVSHPRHVLVFVARAFLLLL
jgi:hypothetical protein